MQWTRNGASCLHSYDLGTAPPGQPLADITRFEMPMFFFQFEVRPKQTHPKQDAYAGAMVNCWVLREQKDVPVSLTRYYKISGMIKRAIGTIEPPADSPTVQAQGVGSSLRW